MHPDPTAFQRSVARRAFLTQSAYGVGGLALAQLLATAKPARAAARGVVDPPHVAPKAKRVIHLCMAGGPSQFETLDYKLKLKELDGKPFPESFTKGQQLAQLQNTALTARGPACGFAKHGQSGQEISVLFSHIASVACPRPL